MALTNLNSAGTAWTLQLVSSAQKGRFHIGAFMPALADATGMTAWRDGVICTTSVGGSSNIPADLQIKATSPTPSLSLTCQPGPCVITRSGNGPYLCYLGSQGTLTLANADTLNPRIDRIVAQVYDDTIGDTLPTTPTLASPGGLVIRPITGTPAGSPSAPATPTGAISLATVAVAANATQITSGNITDTRRSAFSPGGARFMLPGDVITDSGAVSGELRSSTHSGEGGPQIWYAGDWYPVAPKIYAEPSASGLPGSLTAGNSGLVAAFTIPDPGGTYRIVAGATVGGIFAAGGSLTSPSVGAQIRIGSTTWTDGSDVHTKQLHPFPKSGDLAATAPIRVSAATYTGSQTVNVILKNYGDTTLTLYAGNPQNYYSFTVGIAPAW